MTWLSQYRSLPIGFFVLCRYFISKPTGAVIHLLTGFRSLCAISQSFATLAVTLLYLYKFFPQFTLILQRKNWSRDQSVQFLVPSDLESEYVIWIPSILQLFSHRHLWFAAFKESSLQRTNSYLHVHRVLRIYLSLDLWLQFPVGKGSSSYVQRLPSTPLCSGSVKGLAPEGLHLAAVGDG